MSQNPDFEETSLFDLFPAEEKKTDKKEQKNEKTEDAAPKDLSLIHISEPTRP